MKFDLPEVFETAVRDRRLLPFIGAGFSKNIHRGFSNWSEIMNQAAEILNYDPEILRIQGDYLQIAEYLRIKRRIGVLYNALAKQIDNDNFKVSDSKPHLLLPYFDVPYIFTTNWDSWIEKGFEQQNVPYSKIVTADDFVSPTLHERRADANAVRLYPDAKVPSIRQQFKSTTIVKYHGDFSNHESIVLNETQYYDRFDFEHPLDIKLRSEIIGRSVLFIGYSFSDPNVRYLWHKLNKIMKNTETPHIKSFFVTHLNNPLQIEIFKKKDIETILLGPTNIKEDLEGLFEHIIKLQKD
jgi:SIR2-like protein